MNTRIDNLRDGLEEIQEPMTENTEEQTYEEKTQEETTPQEETREETTDTGFQMPEKFKGKSAEEIAKSYVELEKAFGNRPIDRKERQDLAQAGMTRKDLEKMEEIKDVLEGHDLSSMDAKEYARLVVTEAEKRAEARAKEIYRQATTEQQAAAREIAEAKKEYPLLESNKEFRDLVIAIVENAANSGQEMSLLAACEKVNTLVNQNERKEVAQRTGIENQTPNAAPQKGDDDEEQVLNSVLQAGSGAVFGNNL